MVTIRLATFNVENLEAPREPRGEESPEQANQLRSRREFHARHVAALQDTLVRMSADVVGLQEIIDVQALREVIAGTPYQNYEMHVTEPTPASHRNVALLTRFPAKSYRELYPDKTWRLDCPGLPSPRELVWPRRIIEAVIEPPGFGEVRVFVLHLKSNWPDPVPHQCDDEPFPRWYSLWAYAQGALTSAILRTGQAALLRKRLDDLLEDTEAKIAVLGDLNSPLGSPELRALCGDHVAAKNPELRLKALVSVAASIPADRRFSLIHQGIPDLPDHILVSRALLRHFHSAHIFNEVLWDETVKQRSEWFFPESDHAPLVADFTAG